MTTHKMRARWVVPMDQPAIENGAVTMAEGRIVEIGPCKQPSGCYEDLGDVALIPGLVNAHTHLEFSDQAIPLGPAGRGLPAWIRSVIADRQRGNRDAKTAIGKGLSESLRCGVTTVAEIATSPAAYYDTPLPTPNLLLLAEAIGFSNARVESVFQGVQQQVAGYQARQNGKASVGISPHAPYTVSLKLLDQLVELATEQHFPIAMHLAESREELELLRENAGPYRELLEERSMWDSEVIPRGTRPLVYLEKLSRAEESLVVHGNYLDSEEIEFLGQHRASMTVVYCPRTHEYFGHEHYPLKAMLAAGVRVVAGTDSRASNPDLSLLEELRVIAGRFPAISPEDVLAMGTFQAAEAIGWGSSIGTISVGKRADLVALPCFADGNPEEAILSSEAQPMAVWLRGERL